MPRRPAPVAVVESAGARIRSARESAGLIRRELAARIELSEVGLKKLEAGAIRPSAETALRLAAALGIDPRALRPDLPWDAVILSEPHRRTCNKCNVVRPASVATCPACGCPEFRLPPGA